MPTTFSTGVKTVDLVVDDTNTPYILAHPATMSHICITAKSTANGANNIEYTVSSVADIQADIADWVPIIDLQNIGTTRVMETLVDGDSLGIPATALRITRAAGDVSIGLRGYPIR